ncbi:hypothetical protein [Thioclava sp. SK-1]|uniref:hypothetical protein n=1 Tax=Thioclava sp. SK-1 TaxID=1889770 RepID=UPI002100CE08|nr:hypothetical protein [Thioclava sp. SK-1]
MNRDGADSVEMLELAEGMYRDVADELQLAMENLRAGDLAEAKTARAAMRDLRAAMQLVLEERTRVDKLRQDAIGAVDGRRLDFAAARSEIGRRLACLRDAGAG